MSSWRISFIQPFQEIIHSRDIMIKFVSLLFPYEAIELFGNLDRVIPKIIKMFRHERIGVLGVLA
jgi:hypothetical protein